MRQKQNRHDCHQAQRLQRAADILGHAAHFGADEVEGAAGNHQQHRDLAGGQSGQKAQPLHLFAEGNRDEAGGKDQLQPIRPTDEESGKGPQGTHCQRVGTAGLGNRRAQFHRGHGIYRHEQPASQPGQENRLGIQKSCRHHRGIAQDARADHAAHNHGQAEAQAENAQQPATQDAGSARYRKRP